MFVCVCFKQEVVGALVRKSDKKQAIKRLGDNNNLKKWWDRTLTSCFCSFAHSQEAHYTLRCAAVFSAEVHFISHRRRYFWVLCCSLLLSIFCHPVVSTGWSIHDTLAVLKVSVRINSQDNKMTLQEVGNYSELLWWSRRVASVSTRQIWRYDILWRFATKDIFFKGKL